MNIQTAGKTIQVILAPVVMVTACGLLLNGMLARDPNAACTRARIAILILYSGVKGPVTGKGNSACG